MFHSDKISRSRARIFSTSASTVAAWTSDGSDISEGIRRHQYLSVLWLVSVVCIWTAWPLPSPYHPLPTLQWPQCYKLQLWPQHMSYSAIPSYSHLCVKFCQVRKLPALFESDMMSTCFSQIACKTALNPAVNGRGISMTSIFALT